MMMRTRSYWIVLLLSVVSLGPAADACASQLLDSQPRNPLFGEPLSGSSESDAEDSDFDFDGDLDVAITWAFEVEPPHLHSPSTEWSSLSHRSRLLDRIAARPPPNHFG